MTTARLLAALAVLCLLRTCAPAGTAAEAPQPNPRAEFARQA